MIVRQNCSFIAFLILAAATATAIELNSPDILYQGSKTLQFSYNTSGAMGVDSAGRIHLVYFIADDVNKPPKNQIYYQTIEDSAISEPVRVDNNDQGGGRHPSLAIDAQDTVHVVWQDYRHTTAAGKYIDNLEIYYDKKSSGGQFSDADVRLTKTNAGHKGDSGYLPNITAGNNGRIYVIWYDFTINGNNADVYLRSSNEQGVFPEQDGIENFRITASIADPKNYTSNWTPDAGALHDGGVYAIWGFLQGWQGNYQLQGCLIAADGSLGDIEDIAAKSGQLTDPPRLIADRNGNLGLICSTNIGGLYQVNLYYKPRGEAWSAPMLLNDGALSSTQPCAAFDSTGNILAVWQEDLSGLYQAALAQIDPRTATIEERSVVNEIDRDARTPVIALNPKTNQIHLAWIEKGEEGGRSIVYRSEKAAAVGDWRIHE